MNTIQTPILLGLACCQTPIPPGLVPEHSCNALTDYLDCCLMTAFFVDSSCIHCRCSRLPILIRFRFFCLCNGWHIWTSNCAYLCMKLQKFWHYRRKLNVLWWCVGGLGPIGRSRTASRWTTTAQGTTHIQNFQIDLSQGRVTAFVWNCCWWYLLWYIMALSVADQSSSLPPQYSGEWWDIVSKWPRNCNHPKKISTFTIVSLFIERTCNRVYPRRRKLLETYGLISECMKFSRLHRFNSMESNRAAIINFSDSNHAAILMSHDS